MNIHDHGENDPIAYHLTPAELDAAAHMQAAIRFDVSMQNAIHRCNGRVADAGRGSSIVSTSTGVCPAWM